MFKSILRPVSRTLLPFIAANLIVDIDTVHKENGVYLHIEVLAFGYHLVNEKIKIWSVDDEKKDSPIDIFVDKARENAVKKISRKSIFH